MLDPNDAWSLLRPHLDPLPEIAAFRRHAAGRVTARELLATTDTPGDDVSAMDGFALGGPHEPGERRPVTGTVAAGDAPGAEVAPGQAVKIFTGAPVPRGADRVIPLEATESEGGEVVLREPSRAGDHIRRRAEVIRTGERLLPAGAPLEPASLSLLATHGFEYVPVHRAPRVSFFTTGNEVVPPDREPEPGQLRDSHTDFLLSALNAMGLALTPLGIAGDRLDEVRRRVDRGLRNCDVLLISGGVSRGELDHVREAIEGAGCEILFHRVAIQPGKPLLAARHPDGQLVFGLPGNPAAVMVGFWLFVRPALRCLLGLDDGYWQGALAAELAAPLPGAKGRDRFLPARVQARDGRMYATPGGPVGSHDVMAYAVGSALVRIPAHSKPAPAGAPCEILPLAEWRIGA